MNDALIDDLAKQVEAHLHGRGREEVLQQFEAAPTADTVGKIAYDLIMLMDEQAKSRGAALDLDVLLPVATETIDLLVEILEAMGLAENTQELREEAMMALTLEHMRAVENDPEAKAATQELMAALAEEGRFEEGMGYISKRAGVPKEQMQAQGEQMAMASPQRKPLAAGVEQGLMQ